jgi:protein SCO1/2
VTPSPASLNASAPRSRVIHFGMGLVLAMASMMTATGHQALAAGRGDIHKLKEGFANEVPKPLEEVGIDARQGSKVDLNLSFTDHNGQKLTLKDLLSDGKPMLLSLAYYSCPSLCNFHLNGLNDAFRKMPKALGEEFRLVVVSIDPSEKPELAKAKRQSYVEAYGREDQAQGWHFLTGEEASIRALAQAVGFKYRWDENQKQWAHAAAAMAISPDGTISRYHYGITFDPKVLRLSMIEASQGQVGSVVDKLILYCFHFDPQANKYVLAAFNVMRVGGLLIVLVLGAFLLPFWTRNSKASEGEIR